MYNEILLFPEKLRHQTIYPDIARKLVAQACDGAKINPAIFARDANGKTLNGRYGDDRDGEGYGIPPQIIFDGGQGYIRLYGLGRAGYDLLTENVMTIVAALRSHLGGNSRMELKHGDMTLKASEPIMYSIRRLVVEKKPKEASHYFRVNADERAQELKKVILHGLLSCARYLKEDCDADLLGHIPSDDSLILDVLEGEPTPIEIKPGINAAGFKNVTFCTNLDLNGPWTVGKLRSRGHGLIRKRIDR